MSFDTLTLECFIAVSETGSFTKAADRVHRTQSAVSQQMAKLETILGKPLFIRGKNFALTADGEIFYGYARQIFKLHKEAVERFKIPEVEGTVRFGLPEEYATIFLSDVLTDFYRMYPSISLSIECDLTLNLFERFKKKEFEMVLVKMNQPEDFPKGIHVWSEELEWVVNKNFLTTFNSTLPLPLVLSPQPCVYRSRAINALEDKFIKWKVVFSSSSYTSKIAAVKAGLGATVLPKMMIPKQLRILDHPMLPSLNNIHISLLTHNTSNLAITSFEKFILQRLLPRAYSYE